jgi:hypothetical protein
MSVATQARSPFTARTSAFDDFLYAPIGDEDNGMVLTALSALARLGVDPWDEAARLSALPRDVATKRLTSIIAGLSRGQWAPAENIAGRLTALLPSPLRTSPAQAAPTQNPAKAPSPAAIVMFLVIIFINIVAFSMMRHQDVQPGTSPSAVTDSSTTSPKVPAP